MKTCKICNKEKELTQYSPCGSYKDKIYYRGECKECNYQVQKTENKESTRKYRSSEKYKEIRKKYRSTEDYKQKAKKYENCPEVKKRRLELRKKRHSFRYYNDVLYKLKIILRNRHYEVLTRNKFSKKGSILKYLGCDKESLKLHLESKFKENMSWDNYGEWHIDHIIPLSSAQNENELYKLCHYTNLQPLWAIENLKKSDKLLGE
jgi:hypothetical protein